MFLSNLELTYSELYIVSKALIDLGIDGHIIRYAFFNKDNNFYKSNTYCLVHIFNSPKNRSLVPEISSLAIPLEIMGSVNEVINYIFYKYLI